MNAKKMLVMFSVLSFVLTSFSPVWAASRSATIRVSCTILPALELASIPSSTGITSNSFQNLSASQPARNELSIASQDRQVSVNTNLGNQYNFTQEMIKNSAGNPTKLYSVTAL